MHDQAVTGQSQRASKRRHRRLIHQFSRMRTVRTKHRPTAQIGHDTAFGSPYHRAKRFEQGNHFAPFDIGRCRLCKYQAERGALLAV